MICNMSTTTDKWSCTIQLCLEYNGDGCQLADSSGPIPFGGVIHDKGTVELWIRRAQAAILSPHRHPSEFLRMTKPELKSNAESDPNILQFSRNSVRINVCDPDAADISFVDLPGAPVLPFSLSTRSSLLTVGHLTIRSCSKRGRRTY